MREDRSFMSDELSIKENISSEKLLTQLKQYLLGILIRNLSIKIHSIF